MIYVYRLNISKHIIFTSRKRLRNEQIAVSLDSFTDSSISDSQESGNEEGFQKTVTTSEVISDHSPDCNAL